MIIFLMEGGNLQKNTMTVQGVCFYYGSLLNQSEVWTEELRDLWETRKIYFKVRVCVWLKVRSESSWVEGWREVYAEQG